MGLVSGQLIEGEFQSRPSHRISPWCDSAWKRRFDFVSAMFLLIPLLPFMLLIALAVKCTSRGPVLFRQRRTGKDRKEFCILKFRTMICERRNAGSVFTRPADPRITPLGRFLRKWKLDEFPQL